MSRLRRLGVACILSMTLASPTLAGYSNAFFTSPCWFEARENHDLVFVDNLENYRDYCTQVGAKLVYRICSGCTSYAVYDYDPVYAAIDRPDSYIFLASYAKAWDDGAESWWHSW